MWKFIAGSVLGLLLVAGCGSSPAGPGTGGNGTFTARINGQAWNANATTIVAAAANASIPGSFSFQGGVISGTAQTLVFNLSRIPGPGTYPLGVNIGTATGGIVTGITGSQGWATPLTGAAGSVTITTLGGGRAKGSFNFVAETIGVGTPSVITVTDGAFDVPLSAGFTAATPDQLGSRASATINGTAWNAATVVGTGGPGTYVFNSANTEYSVTITVGPITGPGSGPLSHSVPPLRRIQVIRVGTAQSWGSSPNDQGTITVTALSATRLAGTFTATLTPGSGGTPMVISNGSFDLRLGS